MSSSSPNDCNAAPVAMAPDNETTTRTNSHTVARIASTSTSNLFVSEQEDNDVNVVTADDIVAASAASTTTDTTSTTRMATTNANTTEQQVEISDGEDGNHTDNNMNNNRNIDNEEDNENDGDESDYSYDYEDDDDGGHYAGFIVTSGPTMTSSSSSSTAKQPKQMSSSSSAVAVVPRDDNDYLDETKNANYNKQKGDDNNIDNNRKISDETKNSVIQENEKIQFASLDVIQSSTSTKSTWKAPSQQAVSMSLRAEKETTGGRRRLASDLYKIMMHDTNEAGFSVESANEESMDKWTIKLFQFDEDSNLHKDMLILGLDYIELEMSFPDQYPFEPPFVRVVRPRFKKLTGFVMNGALCMELLTTDGWNPVNDIESVIVSIRSLLVVGDGRLEDAANMPKEKYDALLADAMSNNDTKAAAAAGGGEKKEKEEYDDVDHNKNGGGERGVKRKLEDNNIRSVQGYSTSEAKAAYSHLTKYHKQKGWSGWWAQRG